MADEFTRVILGFDEYLLVGSHAVLKWSAAQACESLLEALEDPGSAREIREVAQSFGFAGDPTSMAFAARRRWARCSTARVMSCMRASPRSVRISAG